MAEQEDLRDPSEDLLAAIRDAYDEISHLKSERTSINDKIKSTLGELEARGISKKAAQAVFRIFDLEETEQREHYDLSATVCRKALKLPQQTDLFDQRKLKAA